MSVVCVLVNPPRVIVAVTRTPAISFSVAPVTLLLQVVGFEVEL
jgi:hypothetical protein